MAKDKEKDDDKGGKETPEEIVIVTDDAKNLDVVPESASDDDGAPEPEEVKGKKTKAKSKDDDEEDEDQDEDEEDTRLGASEEDEADDDSKKASKGKSRRQRRREAEQRLRRDRDELVRRNDLLERQVLQLANRMDSTDRSNLESRIKHTKALIQQSEDVLADATTKQKGGEAVEAQRIRDSLRDDLRKLETRQEQVERFEKEGKSRPPPDPRVVANANTWRTQNDWYDPQMRDMDSKIARAIDDSLVEEGFDPGTKAYWKELDKRIAQRIPHLSKKKNGRGAEDADEDDEDDEDEERPQKKRRVSAKERDDDEDEARPKRRANGNAGGPRFRTGGPGRELRSNEVYLSSERIAAMKDSGDWDDPERRNKMLASYRKYDREHGNT